MAIICHNYTLLLKRQTNHTVYNKAEVIKKQILKVYRKGFQKKNVKK